MARIVCVAVAFMFASAVVLANHCLGGGECPSDDESLNVLLLLQAKLQMDVLEAHGQAPETTSITQGNGTHQTPIVARGLALETTTITQGPRLLPSLMAQRQATTASDYSYNELPQSGYCRTLSSDWHCWLDVDLDPLTKEGCSSACTGLSTCTAYTYDAERTHGFPCYLYPTNCVPSSGISVSRAERGPWSLVGPEACTQGSISPSSAQSYLKQAGAVDVDLCLGLSNGWSPKFSSCDKHKEYCNTWPKDMHRCCPQTCGVDPLNATACNALGGPGSCCYLANLECSTAAVAATALVTAAQR